MMTTVGRKRRKALPAAVTLPDTAVIFTRDLIQLLGIRPSALSGWNKTDPLVPQAFPDNDDRRRTFRFVSDVRRWLEAEGVTIK